MTTSVPLPVPIPGQAGEVAWRREQPIGTRDIEPRPHLLVVGAGLAGLSVAAEARRQGLDRVLVIDALGIATRASGRNAGALIPDAHALTMPLPFAALARRGLELHRYWHDRWSLPLREVDWLVPVSDQGPAPDAARLAASGARALDRGAVEECLGTTTNLAAALLVPRQAVTHPVRVAAALARDSGGVAVGVEALEISTAGDRVASVATTAGSIRPDALVLATGRAPDGVVDGQRWVAGHLATTAPAPFDLGRTAIGGATIVIQQPDGRLLVGGTREEGHESGAVRPDVTGRIRRELTRLLPAASSLRFDSIWTGQRPASRDGLPTVDRLQGLTNGYMIAGLNHSGLCTAPAIAEAVVTAVITGELPEDVRPFGARR